MNNDFMPWEYHGPLQLTKRKIHLEGASNFKEMGGIPNIFNQVIKWRMLYRSDNLSSITQRDKIILESLNIGYIIDLRTNFEKKRNYNLEFAKYYSIPISDFSIKNILFARSENNMHHFYHSIICKYSSQIKDIFALLLHPTQKGTIIHCNLGKDRTGLIMAIMLLVLDVSKHFIMSDYLESNQNIKNLWAVKVAKIFGLSPLINANISYLNNAIKTIEQEFGNFHQYIKSSLGLNDCDILSLKKKFLIENYD